MRLATYLVEVGVGAESNGDAIDNQQHGQQQLEGRVSQQLLNVHARDEFLHVPGVLEEGEDLHSDRCHTEGLCLDVCAHWGWAGGVVLGVHSGGKGI